MIRIGFFGGGYYTVIMRSPLNSLGNYLDPYTTTEEKLDGAPRDQVRKVGNDTRD